MKQLIPQQSHSSAARRRRLRRLFAAGVLSLGLASPAFAAASLTEQFIPDAAHAVVGQPTTITLTVKGAKVSGAVKLPQVAGLTLNGSGTNPSANSEDFNFFVTPTRAGDLTIPAFDIRTDDGQTLHVNAIKLHAAAQ